MWLLVYLKLRKCHHSLEHGNSMFVASQTGAASVPMLLFTQMSKATAIEGYEVT